MSHDKHEKALIDRAKFSREGTAFSALVAMHQGRVRGFLVRLCRNYHRADDLAQDTFLIAYEKLDSYQEVGSFAGWLFKIAYHCFLQQQRKVNREQQVTEEFARQMQIEAELYDSFSEDQLDLEKAITQLNAGEAAAITLCHSYGFSHAEVAEILNSPLGTIKSNINRGREKLKQILIAQPAKLEAQMEQAS